MPGVATRACSSRTNEFQAANSGRGSAVTTTVSSTSDKSPNSQEASTTNTRALTSGEPSAERVTVCHPGPSAVVIRASRTPPRSARTTKSLPAMVTVTSAYGIGGEMKFLQPRTPSATTRERGTPWRNGSGEATTMRARMRTQPFSPGSEWPYPLKGSTVGTMPRSRPLASRNACQASSSLTPRCCRNDSALRDDILPVFHARTSTSSERYWIFSTRRRRMRT